MEIRDLINKILPRRASVLIDAGAGGIFGTWFGERRAYSKLVWYNLCGLLLDICEDVKIEQDAEQARDNDKRYMFAAFRTFFYAWGRVAMQRVKDEGFAVVGWDGARFWLMKENTDYTRASEKDETVIRPTNPNHEAYVMRDTVYVMRGVSLLGMCKPWLDFIDDVCNGSATVSKRLGAVVIGSPKTYSGAPSPMVLTEEQKKKIETDIQEQYGALKTQNQLMILPKEMAFQVVNLAGLDMKFETKLRECVLAIADAIPVPANQVALIDANSSKALSNGNELREGDKAKYKAFRRAFERTFVQMAMDFGLKITYDIDGEPIAAEVNAEGA